MLRPYISGPLGLGSYAAQPVAQPRFQLLRFVAELQGLADRADVLKHLLARVRVTRGSERTSGGKSHSCDTPTSRPTAPRAATISVAAGSNDTTRITRRRQQAS